MKKGMIVVIIVIFLATFGVMGYSEKRLLINDVGVADLIINPKAPRLNDAINVNVTIINYGDYPGEISWGFHVFGPPHAIGDATGLSGCCINLDPGEEIVKYFVISPFETGLYNIQAVIHLEGNVSDVNIINNIMNIDFYVEDEIITCTGDFDFDGEIDHQDLDYLISEWGESGEADMDGDGDVGFSDLVTLLSRWGEC